MRRWICCPWLIFGRHENRTTNHATRRSRVIECNSFILSIGAINGVVGIVARDLHLHALYLYLILKGVDLPNSSSNIFHILRIS